MEKTYFVDIDGAIQRHNSEHPEDKLNRKKLATKMGVSYQTLVNFQNGRVSSAVGRIHELLKLTSSKFEDVVKTNNNDEHSKH